jgi:transposase
MGSRVEQFEQIRRDREREGLSIRELARRHGVHRRAVRQALLCPLPPPRKAPEGRSAPKLGPYRPLIDEWLIADREAPRKQRHTAKRVWQRLVDEHGVEVSERQVRRYVHRRRRELGEPVDEVFVPQVHEPGVEAEVDWGEAIVEIAGVRRKVYLFLMRACYSGAAFVIAFERATQQAFLEAHVEAFHFFGGSFQTIRYDNLRSAVKQVLRGRRRIEQDRFVALRSHYLFESVFTRRGRDAPTRRAASKARSAATAAATWCRCRRSARSSSSMICSRTAASPSSTDASPAAISRCARHSGSRCGR